MSVGIVTRTRDRPLFLVRALETVLAQSHASWRIVLVNDGGDPKALRAGLARSGVEKRFKPGQLEIIDNPKSVGRAAAFNIGLAALDTDFVACLDDDDSWDPSFLTQLTTLYAANAEVLPDLGGVASLVTAIREEIVTEADGSQRLVTLGEDGLPNSFERSDFLLGPIAYATYRHDVYPVQWILRREAAQAVGGFPEPFEVMEDRAFMLRFLQRWRIAILDKKLARHHRRARRGEDKSQSAEMNTLDNPSYDWRRFSDLALPTLSSAESGLADPAKLPDLIRAVGASVVKELNDETSALWHKLNTQSEITNSRFDRLETAIGARAVMGLPSFTAAEPGGWKLWPAVGDWQQGYAIVPGQTFIQRLTLSYSGAHAGLLLYANPDHSALWLQIPDTTDWCALELDLTGLGRNGGDLECSLTMSLAQTSLFETALVVPRRTRTGSLAHDFRESHVHCAPSRNPVAVTRRFPASLLSGDGSPKLSIVLPRHATNLQICVHDLTVRAL